MFDDVFFQPKWDKEVHAYAMLGEEQRKKFYNLYFQPTINYKQKGYLK